MKLYTSKFNVIFALLGFLTATALAIAAWARMDWITLLGLLVLLLWSQYAGVGLGHLVDMVEKRKRLRAQIAEKDAVIDFIRNSAVMAKEESTALDSDWLIRKIDALAPQDSDKEATNE